MISSKINNGKCEIRLIGDFNSLLKEYESVGMAIVSGVLESAPDPIEALTALALSLGNVIDTIRNEIEDTKEEDK